MVEIVKNRKEHETFCGFINFSTKKKLFFPSKSSIPLTTFVFDNAVQSFYL